jgi:hypothetical protein
MRLSAHFGQWREVGRRGRNVRQWQVAAGLIYGQVKKSYWRRKLLRVTHVMRLGTQADLKAAGPRTGSLWAAEHRFYRAGGSDRPSWSGSIGASHLGHGPPGSTTRSSPGMVASRLTLCASPCIATSGAGATTSARWQADGAARPPAYLSHGSGKNQPTMDDAGSALFSLATSATLHMLSVNGSEETPLERAVKRRYVHRDP